MRFYFLFTLLRRGRRGSQSRPNCEETLFYSYFEPFPEGKKRKTINGNKNPNVSGQQKRKGKIKRPSEDHSESSYIEKIIKELINKNKEDQETLEEENNSTIEVFSVLQGLLQQLCKA